MRLRIAMAFMGTLALGACDGGGTARLNAENDALNKRIATLEMSQVTPAATPALAAVRPAPPPKVYTGKMVEIGGGVYCSDAIADESTKTWPKVGSLPNLLTRSASIGNLKGLPNEVRKKALAGVDSMQPGVMKKGQLICSMAYGQGQIWNKIKAAWTDHDTLKVVEQRIEHDGFIYVVGMPPKAVERKGEDGKVIPATKEESGCDNDYWYAVKK